MRMLKVMSMDQLPSVQAYISNFKVVRQCRDFDLIHQWARELPGVDQDAADGSRDPATCNFPDENESHAGRGF